jgi:membrane protease YdiL (CAAX protease family)
MRAAFSYLVPFIAVAFGLYVVKNVWVTMLGYHLLALIVILIEKQGSKRKLLFTGGNVVVVMIAFILASFSGVILYLSSKAMNTPVNLGSILDSLGLTKSNWVIFIFYYTFINSVIEEYYWRGYLGGSGRMITVSDICYAGYHPFVLLRFIYWPWVIIEFILLVGVAWMWRMIIRKYKGLLIPVVMHLAADLTTILAIFILATNPI